MKGLARVYLFTILVTAGGICAPFFLYAGLVAAALESSTQATILAIRLLAVAWAGLCVGYAFAFGAALRGERRPGMLWAGIVGNGGTCFLLGATIVTGAWEPWESSVRWILLAAAVLTASVTGALLWYGLLFDRVFGGRPNSPTPERAASAPETAPTPSRVADSSPATPAPAAAPPAAGAGATSPAAEAEKKDAKSGGGLLGRFRGRRKPPPEGPAGAQES